VYACLGAVLVTWTALVVNPQNRNPIPIVVTAVPGALALLAFVFSWRLHVDVHGIRRRRLWMWDDWPWAAFQAGSIRRGTAYGSFVWPQRRWWERTLITDFLRTEDRRFVRQVCGRLIPAPTTPPIPDELAIEQSFRRKIDLTAGGLEIRSPRSHARYQWNDLIEARFIRPHHDWDGFSRLELLLPDQTVRLLKHKGQCLWRGAEENVIAAFVERQIPPDRILVVGLCDAPRSRREAEYRLEQLRDSQRVLDWIRLAMVLFLAVLIASLAVGAFNVWQVLLFACQIGLAELLCRHLGKPLQDSIYDLDDYLAEPVQTLIAPVPER
jgi:hypothetical protein